MKVTVWMTAYNHGKYIARCLDGVLSQKTDFDFDIVLGDDCSTDDTRSIISKFSEAHPGKFRLFLPEENLGMMEMDMATSPMCTGEYLALLNGDDYWTDENKLQIQADFLDSHPDTVMCFHKATVINEDTGYEFETVYLEDNDVLPVESLLRGYNPIMTPTVMMKNILPLPEWYAEMPYGDMLTYLLLSEKGKIRYIDRNMSTYRVHERGQWQGDSLLNNLLKDLVFYDRMNSELNYRYTKLIDVIFAHRFFDLTRLSIKTGDIDSAKKYFEKLSESCEEFLKKNEEDMSALRRLIHENENIADHMELLERETKWKVN